MPILKNAHKALRVSQRRQKINRPLKSRVKSACDQVKKNRQEADLPSAFSAIDKAVKKNILHKNKASRLKAQLHRSVSSAQH